MDSAYLHIVTNHIPIIGVPFAIAILILGMWRRSDDLKSAAFLSFTLLGLIAIVVYLTGEPAEEVVEHTAGVAENAIDAHSDFSVFALAAILVTGALSGVAFLLFKGWRLLIPEKGSSDSGSSYPVWVAPSILLLALACAGMLGYTGKLGGMIRHTEFYSGAGATGGEEEHEDGEEEEEGRGRSGRGRDKRGED